MHENNNHSTKDLVAGLIYTHNRTNKNTAEVHQANATLEAVVELLVDKGILDKEELTIRKQEQSKTLRQNYVQKGMAVAIQEFEVSKYAFKGGTGIDCMNYIHLCKAACCRLPLALSKEDVQESIVCWDLGQPYMIAHGGDGYCVHIDRGTCCCSVYEHRPIPCRGYDCRKDKRIWLDFDKKIINLRISEPDWPGCLEDGVKMVAIE